MGNLLEAEIHPNNDFAGREPELRSLTEAMEGDGTHAVHAIVGDGGIGKTELAKAYAFRRRKQYEACYWLDASEAGFEAATRRLFRLVMGDPPPSDSPPDQIGLAVREALTRGRHLVILDNLEEPSRLPGWYLGDSSRVLVTTRRADLPTELVLMHRLEVLPIDVAVDVLKRHRPDLQTGEHRNALRQVATQIGCHTLALALAATYLRFHPSVLPSQLLRRLAEAPVGSARDLLSGQSYSLGTRYRMSVAASLGLHLDLMNGPLESGLLRLAAFCSPKNIPVGLFIDALHAREAEVEQALARVASVSIVVYARTVSVHPLTQAVLRSRLFAEAGRGEQVLTAAMTVLRGVFADVMDPVQSENQRAYAPHAEAIVDGFIAAVESGEIAASGESLSAAANLGNQLGLYFIRNRQSSRARVVLQNAANLARRAYVAPHQEIATIVNNLGVALQETGHLRGALNCYREAEAIDSLLLGPDHPQTATDLHNLGGVLAVMGDLSAARSYLARAVLVYVRREGITSSALEAFATLLEAGGHRAELKRAGIDDWHLDQLERRTSLRHPDRLH